MKPMWGNAPVGWIVPFTRRNRLEGLGGLRGWRWVLDSAGGTSNGWIGIRSGWQFAARSGRMTKWKAVTQRKHQQTPQAIRWAEMLNMTLHHEHKIVFTRSFGGGG